MKKIFALFVLCGLAAGNVGAQLNITAINAASEINFDQNVPGVVNTRFGALGMSPAPTVGQLDSDAWAFYGVGNNTNVLDFGQTNPADLAYSRGGSAGGVVSNGIYAFGVSAGDTILGFQPTGAALNPGQIRFKFVNNTGFAVDRIEISFDAYVFNDAPRSSVITFFYSPDNINFNPLPSAEFLSPEPADAVPAWVATPKTATVNLGTPIPNGGEYYLMWSTADVAGAGTRDEMGLDNINITLINTTLPPMVPNAVWAAMISNNTARVAFDVAVNASAETDANYTFGQGSALSTATATRNATNDTVMLALNGSLAPGVIDTLFVSGVQSQATNSPQATPDTFLLWFNGTVPSLVITELMYNDPSTADELEYIEIMNTGSTNAELGSLVFTSGVGGSLPSHTLAPNQIAVISRAGFTTQFNTFFGFTPTLTYSGDLANAGETLVLVNTVGDTVIHFTYGTGGDWPAEPNHGSAYEAAFTLHICDALNATPYNPCNWSYSADLEGLYDDGIGNQDEVYASPGFLGEGTCFAELDADVTPICPGVANLFFAGMAGDDATENNYTFLWSFGSTLMEPTYTPTVQDSLITITVTRGTCTFAEELALEVVNLRVNLSVQDSTSEQSSEAVFEVLNPVVGQTFAWDFGFDCWGYIFPTNGTGPGPHTVIYTVILKTAEWSDCEWELVVSNQGCTAVYSDSITFYYTTIGVNDELLRNSLTAYPNPTTGAVRVAFSLNAPQAVSITVTDLTGRVVMRESLAPRGTEVATDLSLSHLPTGLYNLTVQPHSGETATMRVVRN